MTRTASDAVKAALSDKTNTPGTCQLVTRTWLGAPSVGDRDGDGDADAVDGWQSEPASARHTDRRPPAGAPIAWAGGRNGYGHRALSLGPNSSGVYMIRTTDGDGEGRVATRPLAWVEQTWGLTYLGWSETISGQPIPGLVIDKPKPKRPRAGVLWARARAIRGMRNVHLAARRLAKSKDPQLKSAAREFNAAADQIERTLHKTPKR